ncbi:MAG: hypothetical protein U0L74_11400 [Paludibacteraceae bacterium]|nr:hypothetical protein [Paludibacteraceae bacterium]
MRLILKYMMLLGGLIISWNCLALPLSEASCEDEDIGKIERMDDSSGEERDEAFQSLSARAPSAIMTVRSNGSPLHIDFFKKSQVSLLVSTFKSRAALSYFKTNLKKQSLLSSERRKKGYYIYALRKILI